MNTFWDFLDQLLSNGHLVVDRPRGSHHPHYPEIVYPLDYGYLDGTRSGDGGGIDVWIGTSTDHHLSDLLLTVDMQKQDAEIKLLLGCTEDEIQTILDFHNQSSMRAILVHRPKEKK